MLSILIPVYNASKYLNELVERLGATLSALPYELILIDDNSQDDSWELITKAAAKNQHIRPYKNEKNLGQHPTIFKGLALAKGERVVVMDCDLHDVPEEILKLDAAFVGDVEIVLAARNRKRDRTRAWMSKLFYGAVQLVGKNHSSAVGNYGMYSRRVVHEVLEKKTIDFFPFRVASIVAERRRVEVETGENPASTYSGLARLKLAMKIYRQTIVSRFAA